MLKRTALTAAYYVIVSTLVYLLNKAYPSDMCNPGLGAFFFMLMVPLTLVLLFRNIYVSIKVGKDNLPATLIHVTICALFFSNTLPV